MKSKLQKIAVLTLTQLSLWLANASAMASRPTDPSAPPPPAWVSFGPIIFMVVIFYLFIIRPQMKQRKEQDNLMNGLKKGDKIVTTGGLIATVVNVGPRIIDVKLSEDTKAQILKSAVASVYSETAEPSKDPVVLSK